MRCLLLLALLGRWAAAECPPRPSLPSTPALWPGSAHDGPLVCSPCPKPWDPALQALNAAPFWDRAALAQAALGASSPTPFLPFLAKLRRGQPVTVLALGSSVVEGHGGCFVSSAEALRAAGVAQAPPATQRALDEHGNCTTPGYASAFLAALNASFPHPAHLLVNAGVAGAALRALAQHVCLDPFYPMEGVDLVLVEQHGGDESDPTKGGERALQHLRFIAADLGRKLPRPPPLLLLHAFSVVDSGQPGVPGAGCVAESRRYGATCSAAGCEPEVLARRLMNLTGRTSEDYLSAAAVTEGWATLSMRDALAAGLRSGAHQALNWSSCEFMAAFLNDRIHPSKPGARLIADALLSLVLRAQAEAATRPDCGESIVPPPPRPPAAVPVAGGLEFAARRCVAAQQLQVGRAEGWALLAGEEVKGRFVHKPGWVGNASGASLAFALDTRLRGAPALDAPVELVLRHLVSYQGMGAASLACTPPCACEPALLQGYASERVSVERAASVLVPQLEHCALVLTILPASASPDGGHKVKLIGLALRVKA